MTSKMPKAKASRQCTALTCKSVKQNEVTGMSTQSNLPIETADLSYVPNEFEEPEDIVDDLNRQVQLSGEMNEKIKEV